MKRSVNIIFIMSIICFLITLLNAFYDFKWITFHLNFLEDLELITFVLNHMLVVYLLVSGIKEIVKTKKMIYLLSIFVPISLLAYSWYLFFVRFIVELLS